MRLEHGCLVVGWTNVKPTLLGWEFLKRQDNSSRAYNIFRRNHPKKAADPSNTSLPVNTDMIDSECTLYDNAEQVGTISTCQQNVELALLLEGKTR